MLIFARYNRGLKEALSYTSNEIQKGIALPLMESFYTIQGEGSNTGKPAYFIRLGGCDVGCHWCDVKDSWEAGIHPVKPIEELVNEAEGFPAKTVVITGGEPCMYNLGPLTKKLKEKGITIFLETSGAYEIKGTFDWICVSPKKFKEPLESSLEKANELKIIVFNKHDFTWADGQAKKVNKNCKLYLQPEWDRAQSITPVIIDYVKNNPKWNISLQTHKYLGIP